MTIENPFLTHGYAGSKYFCNRVNETKRLIAAIENERHVTLISLRRMGKTGLISHVFEKIHRKYDCVYIDIMTTTNLKEFTQIFSKAILNQLEKPIDKSLQTITSVFRRLKPTFSIDPLSGVPTIEIDIKTETESEATLEDIFTYLRKRTKKIVIAVDEFQQITSYPEKKTEGLLRSHIQHLPNVVFIFSGSKKHTLASMFHDSARPFYQSTEFLLMVSIQKKDYTEFIIRNFTDHKKKISDDAINMILEWAKLHTYYVQVLCNKVFAKTGKLTDEKMVLETTNDILLESEGVFYNYRNLLTTQQWTLLKAIAKEGTVSKINQKIFLNKYHLSASTVQRSIKALMDSEMVVHEQENYFVYDVFLSRWLQSLP